MIITSPLPKVKGKVIPAPMVRARTKKTGVLSPAAAQAALSPQLADQLSKQNVAALPH